jgi:ABC-type sugar transport system ATPase subunit
LFCARFVGSSKANEIRGTLCQVAGNVAEFRVDAGDGSQSHVLRVAADEIDLPDNGPKDAIMVFRPEDIELSHDGGSGFPSTLLFVENRGAEKFAVVELPPSLRHAQTSADLRLKVESSAARTAAISFVPKRVHIFDETSGQRIATGKGNAVPMAEVKSKTAVRSGDL